MARTTRFTHLIAATFAVATLTTTASFAVEATSWGQLKQTLDTEAPLSAAKRVKNTSNEEPAVVADLSAEETRSVSRLVYPKGKSMLTVNDANDGSTLHDNLQAVLVVPSGALDEKVNITMTVIGNRLSDLIVAFQPGGLVFNTPAELRVQLGADLVDVDVQTLVVWHEYADGTVEKLELTATKTYQNGWTYLTTAVPGFSRYGMRSNSAW